MFLQVDYFYQQLSQDTLNCEVLVIEFLRIMGGGGFVNPHKLTSDLEGLVVGYQQGICINF